MKTQKFELLQVFRGLAAIFVLLNHSTAILIDKQSYNFLGGFFNPGWAGVDFFFVLSGFIIFYTSFSIIGDETKFRTFMKKRILRIYPIYWTIMIPLIPVFLLFPSFGSGEETESFYTIVKNILLIPQDNPILIVSWTLSFEMFFYIMFSFLILLNKRIGFSIFGLWTLLSSLSFFKVFPNNEFVQFIFNVHNLEFILGSFCAYLVINKKSSLSTIYLTAGSTLFIITWILALEGFIGKFSSLSTILFGLASALLVLGAAYRHLSRNVKIPGYLVFSGDSSYSLYLAHTPILSIINKVFTGLDVYAILGEFLAAILLITITFVGSCLVYVLIEKPLNSYLRKKFINRKDKSKEKSIA